ncbi:MAG: hypothetical protein KQH83_05845 [Actinobacteria bacterium]|nr:hypothetical protein [Actinomycetota bacterium]
MLIDCNECAMQDTRACHDCVVTHVLHDLSRPLELDDDHAEALELLAEEGMVPVLRLLPRSATG